MKYYRNMYIHRNGVTCEGYKLWIHKALATGASERKKNLTKSTDNPIIFRYLVSIQPKKSGYVNHE